MGNSKGIYWLSTLQYAIASLAMALDLFAIFDLANFSGYNHYNAVVGPTVAVAMSNPGLLALMLWLAGIVAGPVAFCAILCRNHRLAARLAVLATVCFAFVMFIGWADLDAKPIMGFAPTNFYLAYVALHGLLAVTSGRIAHRMRFTA